MIGKTLYLPGFSHLLHGSRPQAQRLARETNALDGLAALVGRFIPVALFEPEGEQRRRVFTPWVTFIAFLGQVLSRGSACRETVRRVQAWAMASRRPVPDENTSAYCQARSRLEIRTLRSAHEELAGWFEKHQGELWCGRAVKVVDGTGLSMPDTAENRQQWPYAPNQKRGCGFPTAQLVGLFCLTTGRLVRFALDTLRSHEIPLARQLIAWMEPGEVVLADRGEELALGSITSGASSNIQEATRIARQMVFEWGMSPLGFMALTRAESDTELASPQTLLEAEHHVKTLLAENYAATTEIISGARMALDAIARDLIERETISGDHVRQVVAATSRSSEKS